MKRLTSRRCSGCPGTGAQMIWNRQATGMRSDFPVCPLPSEFARSAIVGEAEHALLFAPAVAGLRSFSRCRESMRRPAPQTRKPARFRLLELNRHADEIAIEEFFRIAEVEARKKQVESLSRRLEIPAGALRVQSRRKGDRLPPDNPKFNPSGIVPQKSQRYQEKSQGQRRYGNRTRLRSGAVGVCSVTGRHLVSLSERKCAEPGSRPRSFSRNSVRRLRSERGARS
jgi:hypothetical protein